MSVSDADRRQDKQRTLCRLVALVGDDYFIQAAVKPATKEFEDVLPTTWRELLDDGLMEVVVVEPMTSVQILRQLPAFFGGRLQQGPGIVMRSAASMEIACSDAIAFHVDGEPRIGGTQISMRTRPRALLVKIN